MAEALLAFLLVLGTIALFELFDRTNLALISLAAREPSRTVWLGAGAAFAVTTSIAVLLGGLAVAFLAPELWLVRLAGGVLILGYAAFLLRHPSAERAVRPHASAFATAFLLILLLELGDTTMILTIGFVAALGDPLLVGVAAFLGLAAVAGASSIAGPRLAARIDPARLERYLIPILVAVGAATIAYALDPGAFAVVVG